MWRVLSAETIDVLVRYLRFLYMYVCTLVLVILLIIVIKKSVEFSGR